MQDDDILHFKKRDPRNRVRGSRSTGETIYTDETLLSTEYVTPNP
jgi:hypothetical protein